MLPLSPISILFYSRNIGISLDLNLVRMFAGKNDPF